MKNYNFKIGDKVKLAIEYYNNQGLPPIFAIWLEKNKFNIFKIRHICGTELSQFLRTYLLQDIKNNISVEYSFNSDELINISIPYHKIIKSIIQN